MRHVNVRALAGHFPTGLAAAFLIGWYEGWPYPAVAVAAGLIGAVTAAAGWRGWLSAVPWAYPEEGES